MNKWLITSTLLLLLSSCSLFEKTPQRVVEGQRAVYQGILLAQENINTIVNKYVQHNKAVITYHYNFIFEPKINAIREDPSLTKEEKSHQIAQLERERQDKIDQAFIDIDKIAYEMRSGALKNLQVVNKLVESIYNYLSTTPIEIDNLEFWIDKLKKVAEQPN